jgi:hypothetical protein
MSLHSDAASATSTRALVQRLTRSKTGAPSATEGIRHGGLLHRRSTAGAQRNLALLAQSSEPTLQGLALG